MNAHTPPIDPALKQGGLAPTDSASLPALKQGGPGPTVSASLMSGFDDDTLLAVRNAEVLAHLAECATGEASPTVGAVAEAIGRDTENLRKTLRGLEGAGFVVLKPLEITPAGRAILPRLAALAGAVPASAPAEPTARHAEIEPDPDNPRPFDDGDLVQAAALDAMRESILGKGLLNALVVEPSPTPGVRWRLIGGERRWRAIGAAIARGDLPADYAIRITVREHLSPVDRAMLVMIDNEQRQDLHPLDRGRMFQALLKQGVDQDEIAASAGRTRKHVQDMVNLWKKLPDDAKARMRLAEDDPSRLGVKAAIGLIREARAKPALDLTPKLALLLLEVMDACVHRPSANSDMANAGWTDAARLESGGALSTLVERRWLERHTLGLPGMETRNPGFVRVAPAFRASPEFGAWLDEAGYRKSRREALFAARAAVIGQLEATTVEEDAYATDWLNLPKADAAVLLAGEEAKAEAAQEASEETVSQAEPAPAPPTVPASVPTTTTGDVFGEQLRQVAREAAAEAETSAKDVLTPSQRLAMVELVARIAEDDLWPEGRGGPWARVGDVWAASDAVALQNARGLIAFVQITDLGRLARLSTRGQDWVENEGGAEALIAERPDPGRWLTRWLIPPEPKPAPTPPSSVAPSSPVDEEDLKMRSLTPAFAEPAVERELDDDEAALDLLVDSLRGRLEDTRGRHDHWSTLGALALKADLDRTLGGGDAVGAIIALMGLLYRLGEDKAGEALAETGQ